MNETERARWEGEMQARIADAERRLDALNGSIRAHADATNNLAVRMGALSTKVGIYAALGAGASGAAISLAVTFIH